MHTGSRLLIDHDPDSRARALAQRGDGDVYDLGMVLELGPEPRFLPACRYADYTYQLRNRLADHDTASIEAFLVSVNEEERRRRETPFVERPEDLAVDRATGRDRRTPQRL